MSARTNEKNLMILYEDNHIIIINKRVGDIVQSDKTKDISLLEYVKIYIKHKCHKTGEVFLGTVHRIDRPSSGILIFAKTSKALSRLNTMFSERKIEKTYWAIVKNKPKKQEASLIHWLKKNQKNNKSTSFSSKIDGSKKAILNYKIIKSLKRYHLLEINLETGRHHQIRCQLKAIGSPIKGDLKYGFERSNKNGGINLHSKKIKFIHPVSKINLNVIAPTPDERLWNLMNT